MEPIILGSNFPLRGLSKRSLVMQPTLASLSNGAFIIHVAFSCLIGALVINSLHLLLFRAASRRGWMRSRPGPCARVLVIIPFLLLSLPDKSAFLFSSEPRKAAFGSRRWRLLTVTRKTGVINARPSGAGIDRLRSPG